MKMYASASVAGYAMILVLDMCPREKLIKIFVTYLFVHNTFYTMLELY